MGYWTEPPSGIQANRQKPLFLWVSQYCFCRSRYFSPVSCTRSSCRISSRGKALAEGVALRWESTLPILQRLDPKVIAAIRSVGTNVDMMITMESDADRLDLVVAYLVMLELGRLAFPLTLVSND